MEERYSKIYRVSIFEYIKRTLIFLVFAIIAYVIGGTVGWIIFIVFLVLLAIGYANLLSFKLYMTESGVEVFEGFLPWNKGSYGIGWQDCGGASYKTGFLAYILKAYKVQVIHRFTNSSNIQIGVGIGRGNEFVELCNEYLANLHRGESKDKANKIKH